MLDFLRLEEETGMHLENLERNKKSMLKGYVEMALSHGCDVLKAVLPLLYQSAKIGLIWL